MPRVSEIPICINPTGGWGGAANNARYQAWGAELLRFWSQFSQGERHTPRVSRVETRFYSGEQAVCWINGKGHFSHKYVRIDSVTMKKVDDDEHGIEARSDQIVEREKRAIELTQRATSIRFVLLASLIGVKAIWYLGDTKVSFIGGPLTPVQWGLVAGLLELQVDSPGPWILIPALIHTFASGHRILGFEGLLIGGSMGALCSGAISYQLHREPRRLLKKANSQREASSMECGVRMWSAIQSNLLSRLWALRENGQDDRETLRKDVQAFLQNRREIESTYGLLFLDPERVAFKDLLRFCRRIERFLSIEDDTTPEIRRARLRALATREDKPIPLTTSAWHRRLLESISQLRRGKNEEELQRFVAAEKEAFKHTLITQVEAMQKTIGDESWLRFLLEIHERRTIYERVDSLITGNPSDDLEASLKCAPCLVISDDDEADIVQLKHDRLAELDGTPGLHEKVCKVEGWNNSRPEIADPLQHLQRQLDVTGLDQVQEALGVPKEINTQRVRVLQRFGRQFADLDRAVADSSRYQYNLNRLRHDLDVVHAAERAGNNMGDRRAYLETEIGRVATVDTRKIEVYERVRSAMEEAQLVIRLQQWVREGADEEAKPELKPHEIIDSYQAELAWTVAKYFEDDDRYARFEFKAHLRKVESGEISPDTFYRYMAEVCCGIGRDRDDLWLAANLFYVDRPMRGERPRGWA